MGCIRIERILDYIIEPLRRGIRDSSPYVRKTSALCIAKIFDLNTEISEDCGFLDNLLELLMTDSNPMVVSNVIAALSDIQELVPDLEALKLNDEIFVRLVSVLADCTEWGQVFIMDTLADYDGACEGSMGEIEKMIETVIPKLQHANQAVVMSSINLLVKQGLQSRVLPENHQLRTVILRKLSSPLISILSPPNPPEIQYAALRNVNLLVQAYPKLFSNEISVFFCSYNDPQYVKLEKLEIIGKIVDDNSIDRILPELCEYAKDVDGEIVKKAIKVLSQCALNVPRWSGRIREIFSELLETKLPTVLQQVTINLIPLFRSVCCDEFFPLIERFYFSDLESIWSSLIGDEESQSALIWILGEFCDSNRVEMELLLNLLQIFEEIALNDSFKLEGSRYQSQIILAALKIYLKQTEAAGAQAAEYSLPFDTLELVKKILKKGTEEGDGVDLRDRCKIYERILNYEIKIRHGNSKKSPQILEFNDWGIPSEKDDGLLEQEPVLILKEMIQSANLPETSQEEEESRKEEDKILLILLNQLTKLSSIYHQLPSEFVSCRTIIRDDGLMSPLEQSIKSLSSVSVAETTKISHDLPLAWTKLLRNNRPAVANLLDLSYNELAPRKDDLGIQQEIVTNTKDKYANLLDLLD